jgi:hypothetical protein
MLEQPKLGFLAVNQLAAWEALAEDWPVSHDSQYIDQHGKDRSYRCGDCGKGVALAFDDNGARYLYTDAQWRALVVLHLRNHHADLDPDKG